MKGCIASLLTLKEEEAEVEVPEGEAIEATDMSPEEDEHVKVRQWPMPRKFMFGLKAASVEQKTLDQEMHLYQKPLFVLTTMFCAFCVKTSTDEASLS
eukprot:3705614-Amphidinium_carterae.1